MSSALISRRDVDFLLYEWLPSEKLLTSGAYGDLDRQTVDDLLDLAERLATDKFATHNHRNDAEEPSFDGATVTVNEDVAPALAAYYEAGFGGLSMPEDVGGIEVPTVISQAIGMWFSAANVATSGYSFLTRANANLLLAHATPEQIERWVPPMIEGRYFGTMCLSEPQAGSSLSDITTRAEPQADGTYRIRGNKMWISGGDHDLSENIVHLVLARVPGAPAGVKGISLFIVPKFRDDGSVNDVSLAGLNHKMGQRGLTNCLLNFGENDGSIGYLVGEVNKGLSFMFHMMNEARIAVGTAAVAQGYAGYLTALEYARTRPQGRPVAAKDPTAPMVPIIEHPDVRRMLLASKAYVEGGLALEFFCGMLVDELDTGEDYETTTLLLEILTPIVKSWPSQWCLMANDHAIQIHGGYGYTRDYPVEQMWRDNRLNAIHEGTHGIQALDLLGRKVTMNNGAALIALAQRMQNTIDRGLAAGGAPAEHARALTARLQRMLEVTASLWADRNVESALSDATTYLEAVGHVVIAWLWLDVELAATGDDDFYAGKRLAAEYFFSRELPKVDSMFDVLSDNDNLYLTLDEAAF
jgi:butyryl-CoA dehydrogenase